MSEEYDIAIIGGGLVGATLAIALRASSYRVALIESADLDAQAGPPGYDDRGIALSYGSRRILEWLDLWPDLDDEAEPIRSIHISDRGRFGLSRIEADDEGVPALGYVIESRQLGRVLMPRLHQCRETHLQLYSRARLVALQQDDRSVELTVEQPERREQIRARLLVAADGAHSTVRELLSIPAHIVDYGQQAVIANISTQRPPDNTAFERFTDSGPLALLPIAPFGGDRCRCAVVWTLEEERARKMEALDEAAFLSELQQCFGYRLGRLLKAGRRSRYPLSLVDSRARIADRSVLIGNAAQALHPVAGQGFNLALRDAMVLLECLLDSAAADPGSDRLLRAYRRRRQADQKRVIRFTDMLVRLFSNRWPVVSQLRALGLLALDLSPAVRRTFVRQNMGLNMPLPRVGRYRR